MTNDSAPISKKVIWTGYILSALPALLMIFSAFMKLSKNPQVIEGCAKSGISENLIVTIGILEVVSTVIYLIPRTAVLGAILLTGYLGGAVFVNLRMGDPLFFVPVVLGILFWGGLFLRDRRIRALIPLKS